MKIQGCAIVETGSRYQYQYLMTLGCNTNINNKRSGFVTSIPISITGKSIDFERHMTAPEIQLVLTIGFDPGGYFLCGLNLF